MALAGWNAEVIRDVGDRVAGLEAVDEILYASAAVDDELALLGTDDDQTTWSPVSSGFRQIELRRDRLGSVGLLAPFLAPADQAGFDI